MPKRETRQSYRPPIAAVRRTTSKSTLYTELLPVVDRAIRRVASFDRADHDDLVQTAFERIVGALGAGQFAGASRLSTWATVIATRVAIDTLRAWQRERNSFRQRLGSLPEFVDAPEPTLLENRLEARSELEQVAELLGQMRPERSLAVLLHDCLGHDLSEISALTGVSPAAAQSRLVRGRRELLDRAHGGARRSRSYPPAKSADFQR
jgi:RNA polymerase sigma factor (sigma-70 family)